MINKEDMAKEKTKDEELEDMAKDIVDKLDDISDLASLIENLQKLLVKGLVL